METEKNKSSHTLINGIAIGIVIVACTLGAVSYFLMLHFENKVLKLENAQLAKKPEMPISVSIRQALTGSGLVAQFTNHSAKFLAVAACFKNPTTNEQKSLRLDLAPKTTTEIGHLEGWTFVSGDQITIRHNDYESINKSIQ